MRFIYEDRTPGLENTKNWKSIYDNQKRKSRRKGISMLQGDWGGNPKFIPNPAGSIKMFNHMMGADSAEGEATSADGSVGEVGAASGGMGESLRRKRIHENLNTNLRVCEHCLDDIESREGRQRVEEISTYDVDDEDLDSSGGLTCEWCGFEGFDCLYEFV